MTTLAVTYRSILRGRCKKCAKDLCLGAQSNRSIVHLLLQKGWFRAGIQAALRRCAIGVLHRETNHLIGHHMGTDRPFMHQHKSLGLFSKQGIGRLLQGRIVVEPEQPCETIQEIIEDVYAFTEKTPGQNPNEKMIG